MSDIIPFAIPMAIVLAFGVALFMFGRKS